MSLLKIYLDLFRSRGIKLSVSYFFQCHLFDLVNKTDTHRMLSKDAMKVDSDNFAHSLMYMVSWTTTIKRIQKVLAEVIDKQSEQYTFIDVGCGKGKVVLLARKWEIMGCDTANYVGIDFEPNLLAIARNNSTKMFKDEGTFIAGDALEIDYSHYGTNLVFFLYNPFDKPLIEKFLTIVSRHNPILVYVNPVNRDSILNYGYQSVFRRGDWHPNLTFEVFEKQK
jgi:SAM-dependent methyltransferase